ncbi:hypothetical protein [Cellulosimicrobium aquatile]|uniref:hypothetical protein n=1 Tax=Cellulosimicrobium aquatile TaxID=1612203 RepID=UPI00148223AB|nr:hypothetical protein [Cellulosimicrobium aquatile]
MRANPGDGVVGTDATPDGEERERRAGAAGPTPAGDLNALVGARSYASRSTATASGADRGSAKSGHRTQHDSQGCDGGRPPVR